MKRKPAAAHPFRVPKWPQKISKAVGDLLNRKFTEDERKREHWRTLGPGFYMRERIIHS